MKVIINCKKCNKEFETTEYLRSIGKGIYCSRNCFVKALTGVKTGRKTKFSTVKCHICGKQFERSNRIIRKLNFCSKKCVGKYNQVLMRGEKNWNWKDGKSSSRRYYHTNDSAYKNWRKAVFKRDDYECQNKNCTSKRGEYIQAHHIKSWSEFPELRYEVSNGITLCIDCHLRTGLHRK